MRTLAELCEQEGPLPWQRALQIARTLAMHPLGDRPALVSEGILIDGNQVHVTAMPEPERHADPGDDHGWLRDSAVQLWKNMVDRAAIRVPRDHYLAYMSPEQLMGKPIDETSHVYSIGVIAYEMLTKRVPFGDANGAAAIITAQLKLQPNPPSTYTAVPPGVDVLVVRCLQKRRAERFATLESLARAIDDLFAACARM